jgi:hypothetical protein
MGQIHLLMIFSVYNLSYATHAVYHNTIAAALW